MGTKISALPAGSAIAAANVLPMVQSGTTNKITVTQMFVLPSALPLAWSTDTGLSRVSAGVIGVGNGTAGDFSGRIILTTQYFGSNNSAPRLAANGGNLQVTDQLQTWTVAINAIKFQTLSTGTIAWAPGNDPATTADTIISRRAAANFLFGAADAASPVAQTLSVQSVVAGTSNTAGQNLTIAGSVSTGTGLGGGHVFTGSLTGSTGTSQNAATTWFSIISGAPKMPSYTVATLPAASAVGAGGLAFVTDAVATAITGLGLAPTGGGSNKVPVYSDGTSWLVI